MSYIAKPGSMVAHIFKKVDRPLVGAARLDALCPATFPELSKVAYFVTLDSGRRRRKVCEHCARIARREALNLLRDAAGDRS